MLRTNLSLRQWARDQPRCLPSIFQPFFTTKGLVGNDLGLWVSKQISEKHGGLDLSPIPYKLPIPGTSSFCHSGRQKRLLRGQQLKSTSVFPFWGSASGEKTRYPPVHERREERVSSKLTLWAKPSLLKHALFQNGAAQMARYVQQGYPRAPTVVLWNQRRSGARSGGYNYASKTRE